MKEEQPRGVSRKAIIISLVFAPVFWAAIAIYLHNQSSAASVKKYLPADAEEVRESFRHALIPGSDATLWLGAKVSPEGAQAFAKQVMPEGRAIDLSDAWAKQLCTINDALASSYGKPGWFDLPNAAETDLAIEQMCAGDFRYLKYKAPFLYYCRRFRP